MLSQILSFHISYAKPFLRFIILFVFFAGIAGASEWSASKYYQPGNIVHFLGSEYVAVSASVGREPSADALSWEKRGAIAGDSRTPTYPAWSVHTVYETTKVIVSHNGRLWENSSWTLGEEPGLPGVLVWREVGLDFEGAKKYKNDIQYEKGSVVTWNGRLWEARLNILGAEPGVDEGWILKGYQGVFSARNSPEKNELASTNGNWDERASYLSIDTLIAHRGILWKNSQPATPGEEPGEPGGQVWYMVGVVNHSKLSQWSSNVTYKATQAIRYGSYIWISKRETRGQTPGSSPDWILVQPIVNLLQSWSPITRFLVGTTVNYRGYHWVATEDNVAVEPGGANSDKVWLRANAQPLSGIFSYRDWNAQDRYPLAGMLVNFSNTYWVSTRSVLVNERPGVSAAWERVGQLLGGEFGSVIDAIQQTSTEWTRNKAYPVVGTVVTYRGLEYRNRVPVMQGASPPTENLTSWEIVTQGLWSRNQTYDEGDIVSWNSIAYQAIKSITGGSNPETALDTWKALGHSSGILALAAEQHTKPVAGGVWQQSEVYESIGTLVTYNNRKWRNIVWTSGDTPGRSDVWQPELITDGEPWSRYFIYDASREYIVVYNGVTYKSKGRSKGATPDGSSLWERVDGKYVAGTLWRDDIDYVSINSVVTHSGRAWYNIQPSKNQEPGQSSIWQPVDIADGEQWNEYFIYDAIARVESERLYKVTFGGDTWVNRTRTVGNTPGVDFHWERSSLSNDYELGETWSSDREYALKDMVVTYPGGSDQRWTNQTASKGEVPGSSVTWQPVNIDFGSPWNEWVIYDGPTRGFPSQRYVVSYGGSLWRNTQYSLGHLPGSHDSWELYNVPDSDWSPDVNYTVGSSVTYDSNGDGLKETWVCVYPNIGKTPGRTDAWERVYTPISSDWNLRSNYAVGDTVTYKNKIWKARYTNTGFEPGSSDAWSVPYVANVAWDKDVVYQQGYTAVYGGEVWIANYYSSNDQPDSGSGAWGLQYVEGAAWSPHVVYQQGYTAAYGGEVWTANYYSSNDQPDSGSGAWGLQYVEGAAWSTSVAPYSVGMTVTHSGSSWRAKWWAGEDDVPGVSPAWESIL